MSMKFIEMVLEGSEFVDVIDDYVDDWNDSNSAEELHEYLGLSWNEYALWCENPESIRIILAARKNNTEIESEDWQGVHLLAARSSAQQDPEILKRWLTEKGVL